MNYPQYQEFVLSRAKPGKDIVYELAPYQMHILHMAVGIMGEAVELLTYSCEENLIEELGDIEFYLAGLLHALGREDFGSLEDWKYVAPHESSFRNELHCLHSILAASGDILDLAKKLSIYQKKLEIEKFIFPIHGVRYGLEWIYQNHKTSGNSVRSFNKKKLEKRYPKGYSNRDANERKDKVDES